MKNDLSFSHIDPEMEYLKEIYEASLGKIFDLADEMFRPRKLAATLLALSLSTHPAKSSDLCENLTLKDTLEIYSRVAAEVTISLNDTTHTICYSFKPAMEHLNVVPDNLCVKLGDEKSDQIWLIFDNGHAYPVTDIYTPELSLQYFNTYRKQCYRKGKDI